MAYDGFVIAATVHELREALLMGSITKIAQPEKDDLLLSVKVDRKKKRVFISADPSMPMLKLQEDNEASQLNAPAFCMSLRKHIGSGRIVNIYQPAGMLGTEGLERIIVFEIEHLNELGDLSGAYLVCELMGKYSNIILTNKDLKIIDSIKHVGPLMSSVREVLPGRDYFIPQSGSRKDPFELLKEGSEALYAALRTNGQRISEAIYKTVTGFSPTLSLELCHRAHIDPDRPSVELDENELHRLYNAFTELMGYVEGGLFYPNIVYEGDRAVGFSSIPLRHLESENYTAQDHKSISEVIGLYYDERQKSGRIRSRSEDIRHILKQLTERCVKKLDLQEKQYQDAEKLDRYRIYGELINTYGYGLKGGEKELVCENYYDGGNEIRIPLDVRLSAKDNAKRYFERYNKLKRTREALSSQIEESRKRLYHLESIAQSLSMAETEADLDVIRQEMRESEMIAKGSRGSKKKRDEAPSKPLHFVSSDGIDIYVGRNDRQNVELSFNEADPDDWWFHAKGIAGSHVIAKTGKEELPDKTCLEAAALAAYYSRAADEPKVEVDYVRRRELKRVPKAPPGYVIYHTNYSVMIEPRSKI